MVSKKLPGDVEFELKVEDAEDQHMGQARPVGEDVEKWYL